MKKFLFFLLFFSLAAVQGWAGGPEGIQSDTVWTRMVQGRNTTKVQFSPDGNYIASLGGSILIYNLQGEIVNEIKGSYSDFSYSKNGNYLILINHQGVKGYEYLITCWFELYETNTWKKIDSVFIDTVDISIQYPVHCIISPNDSILATTGPYGTKLFNRKGELIKKIKNIEESQKFNTIYQAVFTNDGKYLIYYSKTDNFIKFINMDSLKIEFTYLSWSGLTISADSRLIAFKSYDSFNYAVEVMDLNTRQVILKIPGKAQDASSFAFSPDHEYLLISWENKNNSIIYDIQNGKQFNFYLKHFGSLDWSSKSQYIAAGFGPILYLLNELQSDVNDIIIPEYSTLTPNPANDSVLLDFNIPTISDININIIDNTGNNLKTIIIPNAEEGRQKINVDVSDLSNGNYFFNVQSNNYHITFKLIINK
jgi:WD40 repeat protein